MKRMRKFMPVLLALVLVLSTASQAMACTGVYVGNQVSENGSTYMGRSEDYSDLYGKVFGVAPAKDWPEDAVYEDTYGFSMPYSEFPTPNHTYAYTYVRDSTAYGETMQDEEGNYFGQSYAAAGVNENGVAVTATVTTTYNESAKAADPRVSTGICEVSLGSVLLGGSKTAREAVEFLADIIDKYGSGENNSLMISDPNETWYFEIVSGHQYVAIKMPADKVSVQPNLTQIGVVDLEDTENVVASKDLVTLAQENGFYQTDANGDFHISKSYGITPTEVNSRYFQGLFYMNPSAATKLLKTEEFTEPFPLLIDPSDKLSTMDVLRFLAYRGEGTAYDGNEDPSIRNIGGGSQTECHVFEMRQDMPHELSILQWQAMADAEFSIYVPYYSTMVTEVHEGYDYDLVPGEDGITEEFLAATADSINWKFQIINNLCYNNRANCADAVKEYFEAYQESLIAQQEEVDAQMVKLYNADPELAKSAANALGKALAGQALEASSAVLDELQTYLASNQGTPFALSEATLSMMPEYSDLLDDYDIVSQKVKKVKAKAGEKKATISWKKLKDADGYKIYRATKKNGEYKAVKTIKKASTVKFVNKNLKKGKTYYYKVAAYKKIDGKTVYSKDSAIAKAKIKK